MGKYIDGSGLSHFMGILKGIHQTFVTNVKWDSSTKKIKQTKNNTDSDVVEFIQGSNVTLTAASGTLTIAATQRALATTNPVMDGTAAVGSSSKAAKEDHVHPSDTTRVPTSRTVNDKALSSNITLTGSDISRSSESGTSIATVLDNYDSNFVAIEQGVAEIVTGITVDGVKLNGSNKAIRYGTCATAAGTAAKVVTLSSPCTLETGLIVFVKFTYANSATAANLTLAVTAPTAYDDSATVTTTAKPIKYRGAALPAAGYLGAARIYAFVYDGTNWEVVGDFDTNTTYTNASLGQGYGTCSTATATAAKAVTLSNYALTVGGVVAVKFTYAVGASATLNVNSKGAKPIFHNGAAITSEVIYDGDVATFIYDGTNYVLLSVDHGLATTTRPGELLYSGDDTTGTYIAGVTVDNSSGVVTVFDYTLSASDIPSLDASKIGSGTLGVARGGTGVSTLGAGVVYHSASGTGALSIATAANLVSALGTTAVNRATADASGNNIASTYATKSELSTATAGALQYKGTVAAESTITGAAYKKGWYYVVSTAGTYVGKVCEVGDMLIAKQDKTSTPANDWDAVQSNIETLSNSEIDALWTAATAA
jgi:hypothetical protein